MNPEQLYMLKPKHKKIQFSEILHDENNVIREITVYGISKEYSNNNNYFSIKKAVWNDNNKPCYLIKHIDNHTMRIIFSHTGKKISIEKQNARYILSKDVMDEYCRVRFIKRYDMGGNTVLSEQ